jgi:hypothetical protein
MQVWAAGNAAVKPGVHAQVPRFTSLQLSLFMRDSQAFGLHATSSVLQ